MAAWERGRMVAVGVAAAVVVVIASAACKHDHGSPSSEDGHGQGHGHGSGAEAEGPPAVAVTVWTEHTELFMEYEPLVVGSSSRFAAHVTRLPAFLAATEGTLTVELTMADGTSVSEVATAPASKGIFRVKMGPPKAGSCTLTLRYELGDKKDTIDAGGCVAHPSADSALAASAGEGPSDGIAFTKEQQWQIEFGNQPAEERDLQPSVRAAAEIKAVPSRESRVSAPTAGRVVLPSPTPTIGMAVQKGQVLASVIPSLSAGVDRATLDADITTAQAELTAAQSALARAERLLAQQAVPERNVEEARTRVDVARARADAAKGRLTQHVAGTSGAGAAPRGSFVVRSAIEGTLVDSLVAQGESVSDGQPLFRVVDLERVWLVARLFEPDLPRVASDSVAWFTVEGSDTPVEIARLGGKLETIGHVIDPSTRTAPVIFELGNPERQLRIGQFAEAYIAAGPVVRAVAVPDSAVLDDAGRPVVFVQLEGELFSRRPVKLGVRSKGWTQLLEGVAPGERVVTRGAYQVRLAAASGAIPKHGHVH